MMDYLKQLQAFYDHWLPMNKLPGKAHVLYTTILHFKQKVGWKDEFNIPNSTLENLCSFDSSNLSKYRLKLIQKGLIGYSKGRRGQAGTYKVINLYESLDYCNNYSNKDNSCNNYSNKGENKDNCNNYTYSYSNPYSNPADILPTTTIEKDTTTIINPAIQKKYDSVLNRIVSFYCEYTKKRIKEEDLIEIKRILNSEFEIDGEMYGFSLSEKSKIILNTMKKCMDNYSGYGINSFRYFMDPIKEAFSVYAREKNSQEDNMFVIHSGAAMRNLFEA